MRSESNPGQQESGFDEDSFGHLIKNHEPVGLKVLIGKNKDSASQFKDGFEQHKERLLSLCLDPNVHISPKQGNAIKSFLDEIYEFPNKEILVGETWIKTNNEKQMVLATYINSLKK